MFLLLPCGYLTDADWLENTCSNINYTYYIKHKNIKHMFKYEFIWFFEFWSEINAFYFCDSLCIQT